MLTFLSNISLHYLSSMNNDRLATKGKESYVFSCVQTGTATVSSGIPAGWRALDIGEKTIAYFCSVIEKASTIIWNGPLGKFEFDNFSRGSRSVLESICRATDKGAISIIGTSITSVCKVLH